MDNEKRLQTPLSVHSWVSFFCHFGLFFRSFLLLFFWVRFWVVLGCHFGVFFGHVGLFFCSFFRSFSYAVVSRISEAPLDFGVIFWIC